MKQAPTINFFATPLEVGEWLEGWVTLDKPAVALVRFFPEFHVEQIDPYGGVAVHLQRFGQFDEICIGESDFTMPTSDSNYAFLTANPDCVVVMVPHLTDECLRQGYLGLTTSAVHAVRLYHPLAKDLRAKTRVGMWAFNPDTGAKVYMKKLRYSPGAKQLLDQGFPLLPIAGGNRVQVEEP